MRRERLIRPTKCANSIDCDSIVGLIRRDSVASGISNKTCKFNTLRFNCRSNKTRQRHIRHQRTTAGCGVLKHIQHILERSEERRVGKESRTEWGQRQDKKKKRGTEQK